MGLRLAAAVIPTCLVAFGLLRAGTLAPTVEDKQDPPAKASAFDADVAPVLRQYCGKCHAGDQPKGGFKLESIKVEETLRSQRATWEKVLRVLRDQEMPPPGRPKPTEAQHQRITNWIDAELTRLAGQMKRDPGRVTIRRLNRVEYNNTIRDLVGINFQPAEDFPADDIGYGFDNIGDVLSLPPILLEKYLAAAEKIAEQAIVTNPGPRSETVKFAGPALQLTQGNAGTGGGAKVLTVNGAAFVNHHFVQAGEYLLRARVWGHQAGPEPVKMALRLDGKDLRTVDVRGVEKTPSTFEAKIKVAAGSHRLAAAFLNDYYNPSDPNPKNRDRNLVVEWLEVQGPLNLPAPNLPESHKRIMIAQPSDTVSKAEAARKVLGNFARRAYRRPVREEEVTRLVKLVELAEKHGDSFERGIQLALQAVLVSPHFLFRVELEREPRNPAAVHPVNEFQLASRLSYFLWSTMPDDELFRLAEQNALRSNLEAQVRRMLKDRKARALVEHFAGQWLQTRNVKSATPDPKLFPNFDEALRSAMQKETELFCEAIIKEDRSVLEFIDSDFTFVNERLARHYGIPGVTGDFQRVRLGGDQRGGVLTMASILTITSNPTRTSPVKRGKYILENILGTPPPPPPPDAPMLDEKPTVLTGSLRKRMEDHRTNPTCASCHQRMDPLGFAFENYDAVGAWRLKDGDFPVDPAGELPNGQKFKGAKELKGILKAKEREFTRCLTEKLLTYALGRGLEDYDRPTVEEVARALPAQGYRFSSLILEVVKSDPFQKRRGQKEG